MFETKSNIRYESGERERLIESIAGLFVLTLRTNLDITQHEIGILYPLLENLFHRHADISWETYLRRFSVHPPDQELIVRQLNDRLSDLDKIRILLSLIVLANSDNDISAGEVTQILDMAKSLRLDPDPFVQVMNALEYGVSEPVRMPNFRCVGQKEGSVFGDYLTIGRNPSCDIRLHDRKIGDIDVLVMYIDRYLFLGTHIHTSGRLDGEALLPNQLYLIPENSHLAIGTVTFSPEQLRRIYQQRDLDDLIEMNGNDYRFNLINRNNRFSAMVSLRSLYRNGKLLPAHQETPLFYDDILQIRGYEPFHLIDVIERRAEIGVENTRPGELFLTFENNYYHLSRVSGAKTVCAFRVEEDSLQVSPPRKGWEIQINGAPVERATRFLLNHDVISIRKRQYRINSNLELVDVPFEIDQYALQDIKHYFRDGTLALDGISLEVRKGNLIAILGQSGCGKSTLLKCMAGEIIPTYGSILVDGKDFYRSLNDFTGHIGYVPQDDLLYPQLTVYENLWFRGRLQLPQMSPEQLHQKILNILSRTRMSHVRNLRVGDEKSKYLSGGERKRLNIALELLFEPAILICDEPTSGLSSSDSEIIVTLLHELAAQGRIVMITIHQPNQSTFMRFDRVMLMDQGGKLVFFGAPEAAFTYFESELGQLSLNQERIRAKYLARQPEFMYDVISYPEYNRNGEETYIQMHQGLMPKRKFPPNYWRDKYRTKMLFDLIHLDEPQSRNPSVRPYKRRSEIGIHVHWRQIVTFLQRTLLLKTRNRVNLLITFAEAPLLALIIGFILRLAPNEGGYTYNHNVNLGIYLFISVIVFIFLGLSNSLEDIFGERKNILRERMLNMRIGYLLTAKLIALSAFAIIQTVLYLIVSGLLLKIPRDYPPLFIYFFGSAAIGYSLGLLISCYINNSKAIINILPLILIPQIIFGGAVIQFERMNKQLTLITSNPVPEIVQVIPSRWLFEGAYTACTKWNPYDRLISKLDKLQAEFRQGEIDDSEFMGKRESLRNSLEIMARRYPSEVFDNIDLDFTVDFMDGKFFLTGRNVFLSSYKLIGNIQARTYFFNLLVILAYLILIDGITYVKLKYYYKER